MAIYHLRTTPISRGDGRCATAAAAYRAAVVLTDARTGLTFDYRAKAGVESVAILAPAAAPAWAHDRASLWNAVEAAERRKDARVAREIRVALPVELDADARRALVHSWASDQFVAVGMVADIAIHSPGGEGDDRNHHAHILLTTRPIDPEGFGAKNSDWNTVAALEGWRASWADAVNHSLEVHEISDRVDHRTLVAQREDALALSVAAAERGDEISAAAHHLDAEALNRPAQVQLSPAAWSMMRRGVMLDAGEVWREVKVRAAAILDTVAALGAALAAHFSVDRHSLEVEGPDVDLGDLVREAVTTEGRRAADMAEEARLEAEAANRADLVRIEAERVEADRLRAEALELEEKRSHRHGLSL